MSGMHHYLLQMIERSQATLVMKAGKSAQDGLLFLGNPQLVFPRLLFDDPVLEPVDRNVWAVIKLHAADGDSVTAFPTYEEIMLRCNIGSKATVSRSIAILRACRWLTVCKARLRDAKGRVKGNIYALHDEPLQLAETLELDDTYLHFLQETAQHKQNPHPRAIAVAATVLQDMQSQVGAGIDITELESPLLRRKQATAWQQETVVEGRFFAFTKSGIEKVNSRDYLKATKRTEVQKLYLASSATTSPSTVSVPSQSKPPSDGDGYRNCTDARVGSTETVLRSISSKYIYKNTTTNTAVSVSTETVLIWPDSLQGSNRDLVAMQLKTLPDVHHQPVIDALSATLTAIATGHAKPLRSLLAYTRRLCVLSQAGQLNPIIPITPPTKAEASVSDAVTVQELNDLANDIKTLQGFQKAEPENSLQWIAYGDQIAMKKAEWYRRRDLLPAVAQA